MESTVEFFIENVKKRPCLWNIHHVSYRDVAKKESMWMRVAKECGLGGSREAKVQWKKLRDSHREALRRRKLSSGPSAQLLGPWKYEEQLKFMVTENNREAACNDSNDAEETANDNVPENKPAEIPEQEIVSIPPEAIINPAQYTEVRTKMRREKERRRHAFDTTRSDALATLFDSLHQKTRELPKYLQLRVQREIFTSVTQAEEEALSLTHDQGPFSAYAIVPSSSSVHYDMSASRESQEEYCVESDTEPETKYST